MKTLTTKEAKQILENEFATEDTIRVNEFKGYGKSIKFIKEWSNKLEFLTFKTDVIGTEMIVNVRSCAVC